MKQNNLGKASIIPNGKIVAGSFTTITFKFIVGHPIDDTGYVKIVFRYATDFGTPQFDKHDAPNYCVVSTTGNCRIEPRWDSKGHTRPWGKSLYLKIVCGFLNTGDEVVIVFGDTSGGSPGWQVQTFCEETFEFKTFVDPIATFNFKEIQESPTLQIVPGEPIKAVCIAPSEVMINEGFVYFLKLEDKWGNPIGIPKRFKHKGFNNPGVRIIKAKDKETNLVAESNPIDVKVRETEFRHFWADFHGQSEETIGTNTIDDYFSFARDYALLDIVAHQGNDFQITDEFWETINKLSKEFNNPGSFVTFPGYEWSGNTPLGGDRNVYYMSEGGYISRSSRDLIPDNYSKYKNSTTAFHLFKDLRRQRDPKAFVFAHVGGRYANMDIHEPEIELAVEIHSSWGTFEWILEDALSRGYRIGIIANSDGHKGRPGASYPGAHNFGSYGGLTCVLASRLDRKSIYEALCARHFYATTGNRSLVDVRVVTSDGRKAIMGDVIDVNTDPADLHIHVIGTAPIESVEVRNGLEKIKTMRPYNQEDLGRRVKIVWGGAEVRGRDRMVIWDGYLKLLGNYFIDATPINFWNVNQPLQIASNTRLMWKSITTGGIAGTIITLEDTNAGLLEVETVQCSVECEISSIALEPKTWECGGLGKMIDIYRLPDNRDSYEFSFAMQLSELHNGDNPIYIRMVQEDGHMAFTSPIYLVRT